MTRLVKIALIATFLTASTAVQAAPTIQGVSRSDVVNWLTAKGMKVEDNSKPNDEDAPWLVATTKEDRVFNIFLHDCVSKAPKPKDLCAQIRFKLFWDNDKGITLEAINKFNLDYVFGRGFRTDDKEIGVDYAVNLKGGVSRAMVEENVAYFLRVVDDFEETVKP